MGTEIDQLGGYEFQGVTLGVDGSCKDGKMGSGCLKFREEGEGQLCASWQRRGRHELKQARVGRDGTSVAVSSLVKTPFSCALTRQFCVSSGNGTGTFPFGQQMVKYGYKKKKQNAHCVERHMGGGPKVGWRRSLCGVGGQPMQVGGA